MDQDNNPSKADQRTAPANPRPSSPDDGGRESIPEGVPASRSAVGSSLPGLDTPTLRAGADGPTGSPIGASSDSTARLFQEIKGWVPDLFFAALIALFIVFFVVHPVRVEGVSMQPQLVDQERIFVNRFVYHLTEIHRGDIVVFFYPRDTNKSFIKRVIGLPGETVEVKYGVVYINGKKLEEQYLDPKYIDHDSYPPTKVREGCYLVMGDHRNQSNDSRHWGLVPRENIYGKAMFRYWPVSRFGTLD